MAEQSPGHVASTKASEEHLIDRLDSWKEIAAYVKRDVTTVQRWEKREGMPVHRHLHDRMGSVYAFREELDAWTRSRSPRVAPLQAKFWLPRSSSPQRNVFPIILALACGCHAASTRLPPS